jgi:hypothetical protein
VSLVDRIEAAAENAETHAGRLGRIGELCGFFVSAASIVMVGSRLAGFVRGEDTPAHARAGTKAKGSLWL